MPIYRPTVQKAGQDLKLLRERKRCREDPVHLITNYFQIFETRPQFGLGWKPFALWPRQAEFVRRVDLAYREGEPEIVVEKPRDQGLTTLFLAWDFGKWLLEEHFSSIIGSRKEDMVRLMPGHDTLFAKIHDFFTDLPDWLLPEEWDPDEHFRKMKLTNPETGSTITGDSCTVDFAVGGRGGVIFRDEAARWPIDTSQNTRFSAQLQVDISTVYGLNHFYDQARAARKHGRLFTFHYSDNPNFTPEWYAKERQLAEDKGQLHIFRREIDCDYRAAIEGQIYPNIFKVPVGDYPYNPDWPLYTAWDFGYTDMGVVLFIQVDPETEDIYIIDEVHKNQVPVDWFVPFIPGKRLSGKAYDYSPAELAKIQEHKSWKREVTHYGDPTGNQRMAATGQSVFDILRPYGIKISCKSGWNNMAKRQEMAGAKLADTHIDKTRCQYVIDSFTQYVVPERDASSQATTPQPRGVHKWSHVPSAFEAWSLSYRSPGKLDDRRTIEQRVETFRKKYGLTPQADLFAVR